MKFDYYLSEDAEILKYLFPAGVTSIGQLEELEETKEALKDFSDDYSDAGFARVSKSSIVNIYKSI